MYSIKKVAKKSSQNLKKYFFDKYKSLKKANQITITYYSDNFDKTILNNQFYNIENYEKFHDFHLLTDYYLNRTGLVLNDTILTIKFNNGEKIDLPYFIAKDLTFSDFEEYLPNDFEKFATISYNDPRINNDYIYNAINLSLEKACNIFDQYAKQYKEEDVFIVAGKNLNFVITNSEEVASGGWDDFYYGCCAMDKYKDIYLGTNWSGANYLAEMIANKQKSNIQFVYPEEFELKFMDLLFS